MKERTMQPMMRRKGGVKIKDIQKPEQILDLIENKNVRQFMSTIAMAEGAIAPDNRPTWAINAAREFWRCCFDCIGLGQRKSENYRLGYLVGFAKKVSPEILSLEPNFTSFFTSGELRGRIHKELESEPTEQAADFYAGYAKGLKSSEQIAPASSFLIYLLFTVRWQEIATLKNTTEVQAWLETAIGSNLTGQRDRLTKLCRRIGFPLQDKGGRPRKPRT